MREKVTASDLFKGRKSNYPRRYVLFLDGQTPIEGLGFRITSPRYPNGLNCEVAYHICTVTYDDDDLHNRYCVMYAIKNPT